MHADDPYGQPRTHVVCPRCATTNSLPTGRVDRRTACGSCGQPLFTGETLVLDQQSFELHVTPSDLPVAVVFWAGWSPAARQLARETRKAGDHTEPGCRVALVDGEQEQPLIARLGIRAFPCVVLYRAGKERLRHEGPLEEGDLVGWLRGVISGDGRNPARADAGEPTAPGSAAFQATVEVGRFHAGDGISPQGSPNTLLPAARGTRRQPPAG